MKVIAQHIIPDGIEGIRLDKYVQGQFARLPTTSSARNATKKGLLLLDGKPVESSRFVQGGQILELLEDPQKIPPTFERKMPVIFEDDEMAIVHKPPGLPVSGNRHKTVEHALPANLEVSTASDALRWPRPVHRLDVRTQGLLVVAKTASAIVFLSKQFELRKVKKRYEAIVQGELKGGGIINSPIEGRASKSRFQAITTVPSLHVQNLTHVQLWPETGRTHQLRIHLADLGHPILGDDMHTVDKPILKGCGLFLAAVELSIAHPKGTGMIDAQIPTPIKFNTHMQRESRRWKCFQETEMAVQA